MKKVFVLFASLLLTVCAMAQTPIGTMMQDDIALRRFKVATNTGTATMGAEIVPLNRETGTLLVFVSAITSGNLAVKGAKLIDYKRVGTTITIASANILATKRDAGLATTVDFAAVVVGTTIQIQVTGPAGIETHWTTTVLPSFSFFGQMQ